MQFFGTMYLFKKKLSRFAVSFASICFSNRSCNIETETPECRSKVSTVLLLKILTKFGSKPIGNQTMIKTYDVS